MLITHTHTHTKRNKMKKNKNHISQCYIFFFILVSKVDMVKLCSVNKGKSFIINCLPLWETVSFKFQTTFGLDSLFNGISTFICQAILVWFYGISSIIGYLMPNPLYTYILNIYDL